MPGHIIPVYAHSEHGVAIEDAYTFVSHQAVESGATIAGRFVLDVHTSAAAWPGGLYDQRSYRLGQVFPGGTRIRTFAELAAEVPGFAEAAALIDATLVAEAVANDPALAGAVPA